MWHSLISLVTVILSISSFSSIWEKVSAIVDFMSSLIGTPFLFPRTQHDSLQKHIAILLHLFFKNKLHFYHKCPSDTGNQRLSA